MVSVGKVPLLTSGMCGRQSWCDVKKKKGEASATAGNRTLVAQSIVIHHTSWTHININQFYLSQCVCVSFQYKQVPFPCPRSVRFNLESEFVEWQRTFFEMSGKQSAKTL